MNVDGEERYYSDKALRSIIVGVVGIFTGGFFFGVLQNIFAVYFLVIVFLSIFVLFYGFHIGEKNI